MNIGKSWKGAFSPVWFRVPGISVDSVAVVVSWVMSVCCGQKIFRENLLRSLIGKRLHMLEIICHGLANLGERLAMCASELDSDGTEGRRGCKCSQLCSHSSNLICMISSEWFIEPLILSQSRVFYRAGSWHLCTPVNPDHWSTDRDGRQRTNIPQGHSRARPRTGQKRPIHLCGACSIHWETARNGASFRIFLWFGILKWTNGWFPDFGYHSWNSRAAWCGQGHREKAFGASSGEKSRIARYKVTFLISINLCHGCVLGDWLPLKIYLIWAMVLFLRP